MTASPSPLYSRLQEFAIPVSGQEHALEEPGEEAEEHSSLFERVNAEAGTSKEKAAAVDTDAAIRADIAKRAGITAGVPELSINPELAAGNLSDGFKLHDLYFSNLGRTNDDLSFLPESASKYSALTGGTDVLPVLELDFSSEAATMVAPRGTPEPTGARQVTA